MPYIAQSDRPYLDPLIAPLLAELCLTQPKPGELNYVLTRILMGTKPRRYSDYNALVGVLECVKLEMYRRAIAVYEDAKAKEAGDIPEYSG